MKKIFLLLAITFVHGFTFCQKETDNWFFGNYAGLSFSTGSPVALSGGMVYTNEGCSAISDIAGNILFYTDGISVWNKNNMVMPNGTGLLAGSSCTQAALIVPEPGSTTLYYVFTLDEAGGPNGFCYSVVDMTLQAGLGDVTAKNVLIQNNVTEKLTAVKQFNGIDYWVAVHDWGTNAFDVYSLTSAGLTMIPVVSNTGIIYNTLQIQNTYGQMKFNGCGTMLALASGYLDTVEIFNFDKSTGMVSGPITIPFPDHVYGIEFSRDGSKLYVSNYDPAGTLVQFDLSSGNAATIIASETILSMTPDIYALQIAKDSKIYVCKSFDAYLGVINDPALAGVACNYVDNGVFLDPGSMGITSALGLPGFVQSFFKLENECTTSSGIETLSPDKITVVFPNPSANDFTIQLAGNGVAEVLVYDATGRIIERFPDLSPGITFSFGKRLLPGIYFVIIKSASGIEVIKAVKQ